MLPALDAQAGGAARTGHDGGRGRGWQTQAESDRRPAAGRPEGATGQKVPRRRLRTASRGSPSLEETGRRGLLAEGCSGLAENDWLRSSRSHRLTIYGVRAVRRESARLQLAPPAAYLPGCLLSSACRMCRTDFSARARASLGFCCARLRFALPLFCSAGRGRGPQKQGGQVHSEALTGSIGPRFSRRRGGGSSRHTQRRLPFDGPGLHSSPGFPNAPF